MKKSAHLSNISRFLSLQEVSNNSEAANTIQSFQESYQKSQKQRLHTSFITFSKNKDFSQLNSQKSSFYSQIEQFAIQKVLDDELILQQKVEKRDIIFYGKCLKQSFVKYFTQIIFSFLKNPNDLSFSLAIERLKYYSQQSPFKQIQKQYFVNKQQDTEKIRFQDNKFKKTLLIYSKSEKNEYKKEIQEKSQQSTNSHQQNQKLNQKDQLLSIEQVLKEMFYQKKYLNFIFTFDILICHLTFLSLMLYYWSVKDQTSIESNFSNFNLNKANKQETKAILDKKICLFSIFQVLVTYIQVRSQSININQINILIVFFFLNYLKSHKYFKEQNFSQKIQNTEENLMKNLKLYRRIKKMEKQFSHISNKFVFESQLYKYEYEHKLITNIQKTILYIQLLNTHNFVSSPFQKYYQMFQYQNSRKLYHLKKDYFCIWILNIVLRICEKNTSETISKSAYYIIVFLAILKRFKENSNFQGISLLLPVLYNLKQFLPKLWNYAVSRRKQISERLAQYSFLLNEKKYKKEDISSKANAIINQQVIYEMSQKFKKFVKEDNKYYLLNLKKHQSFYNQFVSQIVHHRTKIQKQYIQQIQDYKKQREIGISFNIYLLDTYLLKTFKATSSKILWTELSQKALSINKKMTEGFYIDLIDYCFIGSSAKYKQLDI